MHDVFRQGLAQRGQGGHGMGMDFCAHAGGGKDVSEVLGKPVGDVLGGGGEGENGLPEGDARGGAQAGSFAWGEQVFGQFDVAPDVVQGGGCQPDLP